MHVWLEGTNCANKYTFLNAIFENCSSVVCLHILFQPTNKIHFFSIDIKYFIFEFKFFANSALQTTLWFAYVSWVFHMVLLCSIFIPVRWKCFIVFVLQGPIARNEKKNNKSASLWNCSVVLFCPLKLYKLRAHNDWSQCSIKIDPMKRFRNSIK